jgi:hypothetical protein
MLTDNEDKIIDLIVKLSKEIDEQCIINIIHYTFSVKVEIQTTEKLKPIIFNKIKNLLKIYKIPLKLSLFNQSKFTLISLDFVSSNFKN